MDTGHRAMLARVFSQVAENLAFMFVEPQEDESLLDPAGPCVAAEMTFTGPFSGTLTLAAPLAFCPVVAANVLGVEPDDELATAQPYDALNELLNVTCGNLLTTLAGEEPVFDLTVPAVRDLSFEEWNTLKNSPETVGLVIEEHPILLKLSI